MKGSVKRKIYCVTVKRVDVYYDQVYIEAKNPEEVKKYLSESDHWMNDIADFGDKTKFGSETEAGCCVTITPIQITPCELPDEITWHNANFGTLEKGRYTYEYTKFGFIVDSSEGVDLSDNVYEVKDLSLLKFI